MMNIRTILLIFGAFQSMQSCSSIRCSQIEVADIDHCEYIHPSRRDVKPDRFKTRFMVFRIPSTPELEWMMYYATLKRQVNREVAISLTVTNVPYPTDPTASLEFYLNTDTPSGGMDNPSFLESMSFYGYKHGEALSGGIMDIGSAVIALKKIGRKPYGLASPLLITAIWDKEGNTDDLSNVSFEPRFYQSWGD